MPFRRRSVKNNPLRRAAGLACEPLESRMMLTAVVNGLFQGTGSIYDGTSVFEYRQANGNANIRISVYGNLTAEFIGAIAQDGAVVPTDLIPDTFPTAPAADFPATFLFEVYVAHSDANSGFSIAEVPALTATARPMQPFGGGVPMRVFRATTTAGDTASTVVITPNDGGVYIGAQTPNAAPEPAASRNTPLIFGAQRGFGLRPDSAGNMLAGIQIAPGNDIGKIFIGGTVTGRVEIPGNIDTFYAGNILTGDASGISANGFTSDLNPLNAGFFPKHNFHVGGDIHYLLSANSFGTLSINNLGTGVAAGTFDEVAYKTGFQLQIDGRVSEVFGNDSFLGQALFYNKGLSTSGNGIAQKEIEFNGPTITANSNSSYFDPTFFGADISIGGTAQDARFLNNTFDTAQWLAPSRSTQLGSSDAIQVKGSLVNIPPTNVITIPPDAVDYYAVPLLGGQAIDIQLLDNLVGQSSYFHPRIGIFDPRGRLVATDYSNVNQLSRTNKTIHLKADIPGSYRIAVAVYGDVNFNGAIDAGERLRFTTGAIPYELRITNAGNLAVGGLIVNQHIATLDAGDVGIDALRGDIGEIRAGLTAGQIFSESTYWYIPAGNLRAMEAFSMGISGATTILQTGPDWIIRKGSIGLLRTTGAALTNTLSINDGSPIGDDLVLFPTVDDDLDATPAVYGVGGNIQVVDCAGVLEGDLLANGAIGTIRTQQLGGIDSTAGITYHFNQQIGSINTSPVIQVNLDHTGNDGTIDLIDVTLNSGAISVYGPAITTGPGGDLRYFHIAATALMQVDSRFGGGTAQATVYTPGAQAFITDDSGASMTLTPLPRDRNPLFPVPAGALSDFLDPPFLTVLTYPIRDKSGVVVMRVTITPINDPNSDGPTDINRPGGGGLQVDSNGRGSTQGAEISEIDTVGSGNTITFDQFNRVYVETAPPAAPAQPIRPLDLIFKGNTPIDIYQINATVGGSTISSINNQTTGEIVSVIGAPDVLTFDAQTIGLAKSHTGAAVEGATVIGDNTLPFLDQRSEILLGDVNFIRARGAIGNVSAVNIGTVAANSDGKNTSGTFEGIAAPIVSRGTAAQTGNIVSVQIGEGIASSGSGSFSRAGVYADDIIDSVTGRGDIRGDIVATGNSVFAQQQATDDAGNPLTNPDGTPLLENTPRFTIGGIRLTGGSIIDADIMTTTFDQSIETFTAGAPPSGTNLTFTERALIPAEGLNNPAFDIGSIRLDGVGGILGALIFSSDIGQITINGGFGVLSSQIFTTGDGVTQGIITDGYGVRDTVISGGQTLKAVVARGTGVAVSTASYSSSVRQSERGVYDAYSGAALDQYNDIHQALGTSGRRPVVAGVSESGMIVDSQFSGSRDLGTVQAFRILGRDVIQTDPVTLKKTRISFGSAAYPMRFNFASSTANIIVTDIVDGLSLSTGKLTNFSAGNDVSYTALNVGSLLSNFYAGAFRGTSSLKMTAPGGTLTSFRTKRSLFGQVVVSQDIGSMTVGTDIGSPSIRVGRNLKNLTVTGSLLTDSSIIINGTLTNLAIGGDVKQGATLSAGAIKSQKIKGQILGDIIIT